MHIEPVARIHKWIHSRKGVITGRVVSIDRTWMDVELAEDHELRYGSESNRGRIDKKSSVLRVRRSCMRLIETRSES